MSGTLNVFGRAVPMVNGIPDWHADPVTGTRIESTFGLFIDFRHVGPGVDIKHLWEVNRHLWWVTLAQHYALTRDPACLSRLSSLLSSWLDACPYPMGPNWSSPVEHGIRLINWSAIWHLIGGRESAMFDDAAGQQLLQRWLESIYQHIRFASDNYSLYSSADNHLIGEAAGVFVAAHTWDHWTEVRRLRSEAKAILEREVLLQFGADGVNKEQAICYHKFSLQFLLAAGFSARANSDEFTSEFWSRIEAAITFLASLMDCAGNVPSIGDADDGEVWRFHHSPSLNSYRSLVAIGAALYGRRDLQAKVDSVDMLADDQMEWLELGRKAPLVAHGVPALPTKFPEGGYVVLGKALHSVDEFRITFDCGPLGSNRIAGHGHADALSVLVSSRGEPLLVDSGTYCYNALSELRHFFRGTHAHNTLVVDGLDQSDYGASFLWLRDVNCRVLSPIGEADSIHVAHDGYTRLADPVVHHRRVTFNADSETLVIEDWLECAEAHAVDLLWHAAANAVITQSNYRAWNICAGSEMLLVSIDGAEAETTIVSGNESPPQGWVSSRFYERKAAPVLIVRGRLMPRQVLRTAMKRSQRSPVNRGSQ